LQHPAAIRRNPSPLAAELRVPEARLACIRHAHRGEGVEVHGRQPSRPVGGHQADLVADLELIRWTIPAVAPKEATVRRIKRTAVGFEVECRPALVSDAPAVGADRDRIIEISVEYHAAIEIQEPPPVGLLEVPSDYGARLANLAAADRSEVNL